MRVLVYYECVLLRSPPLPPPPKKRKQKFNGTNLDPWVQVKIYGLKVAGYSYLSFYWILAIGVLYLQVAPA